MVLATNFGTELDSANVLLNASAQFAGGGELMLGAEIGISTGCLHARAPVPLNVLTTYKHARYGTRQVRP